MKTSVRILIISMLIIGILLPASPASAKSNRIDFTGSEWCDQESFTSARIWEAGPNLHLDGITQTCHDIASIPKLTGTDYLIEARMNLVGSGPNFNLSGKLRMESLEGGVWVGSWVLPANTNIIQVIAHGEGLYEGLELHWFLTETGSGGGPFSGYILTPGD